MSEKIKRFVATYPDYEDADACRVDEMRDMVASVGGDVVVVRASEEENEAVVAFTMPPEHQGDGEAALIRFADGSGWDIREC